MPTMFKELFLMFTLLFSAFSKYIKAFDHVGTYVEESTGTFADQARIDRKIKIAALEDQRKAQGLLTQS